MDFDLAELKAQLDRIEKQNTRIIVLLSSPMSLVSVEEQARALGEAIKRHGATSKEVTDMIKQQKRNREVRE